MCASDSNSLSSLQSTMARLIPCKQNSWPGQVKISKNIINVGEKYHPHMAINTPHMAIFNEQSHYYTRVSGGLLQFSLGKGFLTIPSCHLLLAELGILRDQGVVLGAKLGLQSAVQEARDKSGLGKGS